MTSLDIRVDLSEARARAEETIRALNDLRASLDLSRYEFTHQVRVAAMEQPRSRPVLTLPTVLSRDRTALLGTYLHQQMRWYLERHCADALDAARPLLAQAVRHSPIRSDAGTEDPSEVRLGLACAWLELEALTDLLGQAEADRRANRVGHRRWLYSTVQQDHQAIGAILEQAGITPIPHARESLAA